MDLNDILAGVAVTLLAALAIAAAKGFRTTVAYRITSASGTKPDEGRKQYGTDAVAAKLVTIYGGSIRHLADVRLRVSVWGKPWSIKAQSATSIDVKDVKFEAGDYDVTITIPDLPRGEKVEVSIFYDGTSGLDRVEGGGRTYRVQERHTLWNERIAKAGFFVFGASLFASLFG